MQVQRVCIRPGRYSWIVIDDNYLPIKPVMNFLRHLDNVDKSPCTLRSYANHLKLFWGYLKQYQLDWKTLTLEQLSNFVGWLRQPQTRSNVIKLVDCVSARNVNADSQGA